VELKICDSLNDYALPNVLQIKRVKVSMGKSCGILFLVCMAACTYNDAAIQNGLHISFSQGQGKSVSAGDPSFQILIEKISDSRCPIGLYCIWGGEASVTFQIVSSEYVLKIGESKIFSDNQRSYKLILKDVTPFPSTTNMNAEKKAVFTLEKL